MMWHNKSKMGRKEERERNRPFDDVKVSVARSRFVLKIISDTHYLIYSVTQVVYVCERRGLEEREEGRNNPFSTTPK